jgi:hypothetical protein
MGMPTVCAFTSIARPLRALGPGRPGATALTLHDIGTLPDAAVLTPTGSAAGA